MNVPAETGVILAQHAHHFFRLRHFGEGREAAQIAEHHRHLAAVALQQRLVVLGNDDFRDLRRQEALEPRHALELRHLLRDAALQRRVPIGELARLRFELDGLRLHRVMQCLGAQDRAHARQQRGGVDRLGQIFIAAGIEAGDDIARVVLGRDQDDRDERQRRIGLQLATDLKPVLLGHHDVEQDQVRLVRARLRQRLLAIARGQDAIALAGEPRLDDVDIGRVVVDDQHPGRRAHVPSVPVRAENSARS